MASTLFLNSLCVINKNKPLRINMLWKLENIGNQLEIFSRAKYVIYLKLKVLVLVLSQKNPNDSHDNKNRIYLVSFISL